MTNREQQALANFETVVDEAEAYYDSDDADNFYFNIWGGEDIHIGLYDLTDDIAKASRFTVQEMARIASPIVESTKVLDIGAGYGGAVRQLAKAYGCHVTCLNLSRTQNATNNRLTKQEGLEGLIDVVHGNFENIPAADDSFDLVWSQDAILHSAHREDVIHEVLRVLKAGGKFVFTDPMQSDTCPEGVLQNVYDRIHLKNLGSFAFYRATAREAGFIERHISNRTDQLLAHYSRVREELQSQYDRMVQLSSKSYVDNMNTGLMHWISAAKKGYLAWGVMCFEKK